MNEGRMSELPPGYALRRPESSDAEAIVALIVSCDIADVGRADSTPEDLVADWALPRFDRSRDAWIVVAPDRAVVGYAWEWDRVAHVDIQADLFVRPELRGKGIEEVLLRILESRGREHAAAAPSGNGTDIGVFTKPEGLLTEILGARGYSCVRTFLRMTIDLTSGYPPPRIPDGIKIRPFRLDSDEQSLHHVIASSFADHFRFAPEAHEEWVSRRVGHPEFDPDLWLIAEEGGEVVGGVLAYQFGDLGWIRELGVLAKGRGRGVGKALLLSTFQAFGSRGQHLVSLGVDAENASGATRLYESVGMHVEQRHDLYQLPLRPER